MTTPPRIPPGRSIKARLIVGTVAIVLAVVCLLTFVIARSSAGLLQKESMRQLSQLLSQSTDILSGFADVREANLELWAANPLVQSVVNDPALGAVFVPSLRDYFARFKLKEPWIENILLVKDGAVVYDDADAVDLSNDSADDRLKNILAIPLSGLSVLNLSALQPDTDQWVLALRRQLIEEGAPIEEGFIVLLLDLETIQAKLFGAVTIGQNGFLSIVAELVTAETRSIWLPRQRGAGPERSDFLLASQQQRLLTESPARFNSIVFDYRMLGDSPLAIVGVASEHDVREPVMRLIYTSVLFGVLASLLGIVGAFFFSQKLAAPIRELTANARRFTAGDLQLAAVQAFPELGTLADEHTGSSESIAGNDEVAELSLAFNQMANDIGNLIGELELRDELSRSAISTRDLDRVLALVVQGVAKSGGYDRVRLYLYDEQQDRLLCRTALGMEQAQIDRLNRCLAIANTSVSKWVFVNKTPYVVEDAQSDPKCDPATIKLLGLTSYAAVPLLAGEKALGVLAADYVTKQRQFPEERLNSLAAFAGTAALAIENSLLYSDLQGYNRTLEERVEERTLELEERLAQLDTLNRITQTVISEQGLQTQLEIIAREMVHILNIRDAGMALLNSTGTELTVVAFYTQKPEQRSTVGTVIPLADNPVTQQVMTSGQTVVINDAQNTPLFSPELREVNRVHDIRTLVIIPLVSKGKSIGTVGLSTAWTDREFTPSELNLAETAAANVVGAIENARLFDDAQSQRGIAESLRQVASVLNASLDLNTILSEVMSQLRNVIQCDSGAVFLHQGDELVLVSGTGIDDAYVGYSVPLPSELPEARVFQSRHSHIIHDVRADRHWQAWTDEDPVRAWMAAPLLVGDQAIGILTTDSFTTAAFGEQQLRVLQAFADHATSALENARLYATAEEAKRAMERANQEITTLNERLTAENLRLGAELEVTRQLQQMILPTPQELTQVEGLDIASFMEPADEVGGDYYDVLQCDGRIKIGIGDVTGHGLESGVLMLMTQTAVRTLLTAGESDPVRFLDVLNRTIYDNVQRMSADKNLTLSLVDYTAGEVRLSGQHENLILVRRDGSIELVDTVDLGFPIGLDREIATFIDQTTLHLRPGDGIVLYTDGITEAENPAREQYGLERLCALVSRQWAFSAEAIKDTVVTDVRRHIAEHQVYDDITLLIAKQN